MPKRIIFCSDGTWNDAATNTNVYKIFKAMNFTAEQCPIYDDGVGADGNPVLHFLGGAFGEGLDQKIRDGYTRLSHLYEHGDQVFLFGFSRGAYTARSLGGMIVACGLPTQHTDDNLTALAFAAYREHDPAKKQPLLAALKQTYAVEQCHHHDRRMGHRRLTGHSGHLRRHRHAALQFSRHQAASLREECLSRGVHRRTPQRVSCDALVRTAAPGQTIEQVYFTGVHCDVGGGYPETGCPTSRWAG